MLQELHAPAGSKEELIGRLKELLPPGTDFEKLAGLGKIFGTSGELEAAEVGFLSRNPVAVLGERTRGEVGVEVPGQGGLVRQAGEFFLGLGEIQVLRREEFDALVQSMVRIEKEGGVVPIQPAADEAAKAMARAATAMESAANALQEQADQPRTVNIHNNNVKNTHPSAKAQREVIRNGQNDLLRRAGG